MYNHYMPLLRKIFFYLFALVYLIVCPLIIMRLLGFVREPHSGHWIKTGIIYVSSNPPSAQVYINGKLTTETTPTVIRDLLPGEYNLRIELNGYAPWENTIPVVDKKATSVENILLIPTHWKIKSLSNVPMTNLIPVPGNNYMLVASDETVKDLYILRFNRDLENKADADIKSPSSDLEPLFSEESIYRDAKLVHFYVVDNSPYFVMEVTFGDKNKYLWVDPRERQAHIEDISDLLPSAPQKLFWVDNDEKNIFAFYDNTINRINIKEKAIFPNIEAKDIPSSRNEPDAAPRISGANQTFLINNGNTLLYRRDNDIYLIDTTPFGQPRLTNVLRTQEHTDVYFAEKTGKLYFINDRTHVLSSMQILHHKPFIPKPIADTLRLQKLEK